MARAELLGKLVPELLGGRDLRDRRSGDEDQCERRARTSSD